MRLVKLTNIMEITGKINLVLTLACASILLAVFLSFGKVESQNIEALGAVSAQIDVFKLQLVSSEQESQWRQISLLLDEQSAVMTGGSRKAFLSIVGSCLLVGLLIWFFLRQLLFKPLGLLANAAGRLQSDDTTVIIPDLQRTDDVGVLCDALNSYRSQCLSVQDLQESAGRQQQEHEREIYKLAQQAQQLEKSRAKVCELEEALTQAQVCAASEASLQQRVQQLSETVSVAAGGDLKVFSKKLERVQNEDDALGRMAIDLGKILTQVNNDVVSIGAGAGLQAESANHLQGIGKIIIGNAGGNHEKAKTILSGAKNVRSVLVQVSTNVEQMESSIQGISDNATQASVVAAQAVELAQNTSGTMRKLAESSVDINNVIKLITSIAEQTNLLALNATIEAARAGDAGKGFAVVANEVKELAKETNKATDEIQRRITAIRTETGHAVEAIGDINQIVSQIDGLQGDISESVRGQSAAVQAITTMIGNATKDNKTVREVLAKMLEVLGTTQASAENILSFSETLRTGAEGQLKITRRYTV